MGRFCDIKTRNEFADFFRIPHGKLTHILYVVKPENYYKTFEIPKKNGEPRTISAPSGDLKELQAQLASALEEYQKALQKERNIKVNISHAFEKGKSIISNAQIHKNKRYVLNLDLQDFFPSIHFGRVQGFFQKNRDFLLPYEIAVIIAQIVCYNKCLPQGAPSSPIISNLICQILDMRILKIAKKYKVNYTRYADDLTFSTNCAGFLEQYSDFLREISAVIEKSGFVINEKKTRLQYRSSRQEVTGLVVNKKLSVNRIYVKKTRAMAHRLYTCGSFEMDGRTASLRQLEGRFSFINQIDHYNNKLDLDKHDAYHLNGREEQYQAFLFYRYFYANRYPLIITEGKTDIRYLKSALKCFYKDYPLSIEKDGEGKFQFKIRFFRRSKRWKYFFGMSLDGADAMKILYRYFTGGKGCRNYFDYFNKLHAVSSTCPVMLLYDNETESKRPLRSFLNEANLSSEENLATLQKQLYMHVIPDSNLFLLTNPLVGKAKECEIEDLFKHDFIDKWQLGGKSFCRKDTFDKDKYCGKDIFSEYVQDHYQEIDFTGFKPLLDSLNAIVEQCTELKIK